MTSPRHAIEDYLARTAKVSPTEISEALSFRLDDVQAVLDALVAEGFAVVVDDGLYRLAYESEFAAAIAKRLPAAYATLRGSTPSTLYLRRLNDALLTLYHTGKAVTNGDRIERPGSPAAGPTPYDPISPTEQAVHAELLRGDPRGMTVEAIVARLDLVTPTVQEAAWALQAKKLVRKVDDRYLAAGPERLKAVRWAVQIALFHAYNEHTAESVAVRCGYPVDEVQSVLDQFAAEGLLTKLTGPRYLTAHPDDAARLVAGLLPTTVKTLVDKMPYHLWELVVLRGVARLLETGRVVAIDGTLMHGTHVADETPKPAPLLDYVEAARVVVDRTRALLRGLGLRTDNELDAALSKLGDLTESEIVGTDVEELRAEIGKREKRVEEIVDEVEGLEDSLSTLVGQAKDVLRRFGRRRPY